MAAFDIYRANTLTAANRSISFNWFSGLVGSVTSWNDARVTRNALSELSNRELEDIGLIRGDIDDIARGVR